MLTYKRKPIGEVIGDVIIYAVLTVLAIIMVIPFVYVIAASFAPESEILTKTALYHSGNLHA